VSAGPRAGYGVRDPQEAPSRVKIWFYPKSSGKLLGISNGAVPCQGWHFDKLTMTLARRTD
jgi:hypothetical protein